MLLDILTANSNSNKESDGFTKEKDQAKGFLNDGTFDDFVDTDIAYNTSIFATRYGQLLLLVLGTCLMLIFANLHLLPTEQLA